MRTILKISTVLSWLNLVVWGFITAILLLGAITSRNLPLLVFAFLLSAVVLHSYAALQLRKSIKNPSIPLSSHTPTGIRFIGAIALFFGIAYFAYGIALLQDAREFMKMVQPEFPQFKELRVADVQRGGIFILFLGISIALNVVLNFRLLRWYHFMKGVM